MGPGRIGGAAGVGGEGSGGVGVVVEPLGRTRARGGGLVPREIGIREEAPRGRRGRRLRRRRVGGRAEGEEALPALGRGLLRFVLAAVHLDPARSESSVYLARSPRRRGLRPRFARGRRRTSGAPVGGEREVDRPIGRAGRQADRLRTGPSAHVTTFFVSSFFADFSIHI